MYMTIWFILKRLISKAALKVDKVQIDDDKVTKVTIFN